MRRDGDRASGTYKWTRGIGTAIVQILLYFAIGYAHLERSTELLRIRLDDVIPFWPWTAWFYMPFYAGIFVICIVSFRSRKLFNLAMAAMFIVMIVAAVGHLLVGAEYPRPILRPPYPDISARFLAFVQGIDPPGNVFPSLHVAQTSMLAFLLCRDRPVLGRVTIVMAAMLALSTLTTKQHFVADVVSGYALAFLARAIVLWRHSNIDGSKLGAWYTKGR